MEILIAPESSSGSSSGSGISFGGLHMGKTHNIVKR